MHRILVVGGGSAGMGVARLLLEASRMTGTGPVVVVDGADASERVVVRNEDGTTQVEELNTDEMQMLVALRGRETFSRELTLHARNFIHEPEWVVERNYVSNAERKAHWQQSNVAGNRKFQSMQAKARRR